MSEKAKKEIVISEGRDFKGIWIPERLYLSPDLSPREKFLLIEIYSLTQKDKGCFASNKHFANFIGLKENSIQKMLLKFEQLGLIERIFEYKEARSTARHYSAGAIIVCRVTLGSTLDLGMAPYHVYYQCGKPNALEATRWGLENNYVTGEWWRPDEGWWEYCMYDWQNRYNYSWRIRPLYVIDLDSGYIQRIPGGMCHWLFRKMVIMDLLNSMLGD